MAKDQEQYFAFTADMLKQVTDKGDDITAMIKSIARTQTNLLKRVAVCAASIVCHAIQHGDVTKADALVNALEGWRRNDLRQWFLDNGPFAWVTADEQGNKIEGKFKINDETKASFKAEYAKNKGEMIAALLEVPFWIYKKDPVFKPFDLPKQLKALIARAEGIKRNKDESKAKHPDNNFDGLAQLKGFVKALEKNEVVEEDDNNGGTDDAMEGEYTEVPMRQVIAA